MLSSFALWIASILSLLFMCFKHFFRTLSFSCILSLTLKKVQLHTCFWHQRCSLLWSVGIHIQSLSFQVCLRMCWKCRRTCKSALITISAAPKTESYTVLCFSALLILTQIEALAQWLPGQGLVLSVFIADHMISVICFHCWPHPMSKYVFCC